MDAKGGGKAKGKPRSKAQNPATRHRKPQRRYSGFQDDGHRPFVCGRKPPIQKPDVQHKTFEGGRIGQSTGKPKSTEPAFCYPYYTGTYPSGYGCDLSFGNNNKQLLNGTVLAVQIPATKSIDKTGH